MNSDLLIAYVGKSHGGIVEELTALIDGEIEELDDDKYVYSVNHGLEYLLRGDLVFSLKLFSDRKDWCYCEYLNELPFNLKWRMKVDDIRRIIGQPLGFQNGNMILGLQLNKIDKYKLNNYNIYLSYCPLNNYLIEVGIQKFVDAN